MIILLDGSKGAGKSTTAQFLLDHLENPVYLSIDEVRRGFSPDHTKDIREKNKEAFEIIILKTVEGIESNRNVIIDCGLSTERLTRLEEIATKRNISLHKFFLKASYEIQLNRVRERDRAKGKEDTDVKRFDEIHKHIHSKNLSEFVVIETDKYNLDQVGKAMLDIILK